MVALIISWFSGSAILLPAAEPDFALIGKAQPDEFYHGLGGTYYPLGEQPPDLQGQPKVNQAYVWSMVRAGESVWFGTAANPVALALGGITGLPVPIETEFNVFEFRKSQYPGVSPVLKIFLGDWRPPEIWRINAQGQLENRTPDHPLIQQTLGMRSAGANSQIVLVGGPDLTQLGINLFAFDAQTGAFLDARHIREFSDIRRWITVNDVLYTGTLNTYTLNGGGSVLRWRGSLANPFDYDIVGQLDNEAATVTEHDGRLFAFTWSTLSQTVETVTGARATSPAGVWMSPPLTDAGLTIADRHAWSKVWDIRNYEPDAVIWRSLWMGAAASFDGSLLFGTLQIPGYGAQVLKEEYGLPGSPDLVAESIRKSFRPAAFFRGQLNRQGEFQVELLYGDSPLWTYQKTGNRATWTQVPNGLGSAKFGKAGFGNPYNQYVWSMLPHQNRLWIGTFDMSFILFGNKYVDGEAIPAEIGGDLLMMEGANRPATFVSKSGVGNVANNGIRTMLEDGDGFLMGTATSANLLTDPNDDLVEGGWEIRRYSPNSAATTTPVPLRKTSR
ncbi:hypothetical protein GC163_16640 [bacterium]|nr:hypothetical protein [bacterium]